MAHTVLLIPRVCVMSYGEGIMQMDFFYPIILHLAPSVIGSPHALIAGLNSGLRNPNLVQSMRISTPRLLLGELSFFGVCAAHSWAQGKHCLWPCHTQTGHSCSWPGGLWSMNLKSVGFGLYVSVAKASSDSGCSQGLTEVLAKGALRFTFSPGSWGVCLIT